MNVKFIHTKKISLFTLIIVTRTRAFVSTPTKLQEVLRIDTNMCLVTIYILLA